VASFFDLVLDTTAPQDPEIVIESGGAYVTTQNITAHPGTSDADTTGYQMKIWGDVDTSNDPDIQDTEGASAWITFNTSKAVKLSSGDGSKTLHCKIRDDVLNTTAEVTASVTLDTTVPVATISVAASPTKISKVATKDTSTFQWQADVHIQAYKVKVVPSSGSPHTAGTQIPTTAGSSNTSGGAVNATTNVTSTIKGADLESASAGDGTKIVKVFVQDDAGNWSV